MTVRKPKKEVPRGLFRSHLWGKFKPYIYVEVYDRDGGHRRPRVRFEVLATPSRMNFLISKKFPCVHCGNLVPFVRPRRAERFHLGVVEGHYYLAVTCPLTETFACARSGAAREEYRRIKLALRPDLGSGLRRPPGEPRRPVAGRPRRRGQKVESPSVSRQMDLWITSKKGRAR